MVELPTPLGVQPIRQPSKHGSLGSCGGFGAEAFHDRHWRQNDPSLVQFCDDSLSEHQASGGLRCRRFQPRDQGAIVLRRELLQAQALKEFSDMLTPRFVTRCIEHSHIGSHAKLCGDEVQKSWVGFLFFS